jgi:phage gp16-like protein
MHNPELKKKIQKINVLGRTKLGMDNEMLHDFVYTLTKKKSIKELTVKESNLVISTMLKEILPGQSKAKGKNIIWLITDEQMCKIETLGGEMAWDLEQMNKFAQRQYRKNVNQLTSRQAQSLIEALKIILSKKENQGA